MANVSFLSRIHCELGEGPFYCDKRDTLFWFDIVGKRRHAHDFATGQQSVLELPEMTSAMGLTPDGKDVHLTETGLYVQDGGGWTQVAAIEADNPDTRSNDARIHPSGAFWIGTMGKGNPDVLGKIYRYFEGTLEPMFDDIKVPNSICFSPDGAIAYYADSASGTVMRVNCDPATGAPTGEPQVHIAKSDRQGVFDGSVCDDEGNLWNARWGNGSLDCYAPDGSLVDSIAVPVTQSSCPAFVGGNRIAVTSAYAGMDTARRAADPDAGATVLVELDRDIKPRFEPPVRL